jgi:thiol-disulfide isomerase/thioredoxin
MKRIISLIAIFLLCSFVATAQEMPGDSMLRIGDKVPELYFNKVLNYPGGKARLSDFKGKLVILSFWNSYCSSCIAGFPKMDALQEKFGDRLQVLLVDDLSPTIESMERIHSILDKNKKRTGYYPKLPMPLQDTVLSHFFPKQSVPHEVWINKEGIVSAITRADQVTERNISRMLSSDKVHLPLKNDWGFDRTQPFLLDGNGTENPSFLFRTLITGYKADLSQPSGFRTDSAEKLTGIYFINHSLYSLLQTAYMAEFGDLPMSNIILDVRDAKKYAHNADTANLYCYDASFPPVADRNFDREDLKKYWNVRVRREKRKMSSIIIQGHKDISRFYTHVKNSEASIDKEALHKYYHGATLSKIARSLSSISRTPFVDESGFTSKIDIDFPGNIDLDNSAEVMNFLKKLGFDIKEEARELDVVIITDK